MSATHSRLGPSGRELAGHQIVVGDRLWVAPSGAPSTSPRGALQTMGGHQPGHTVLGDADVSTGSQLGVRSRCPVDGTRLGVDHADRLAQFEVLASTCTRRDLGALPVVETARRHAEDSHAAAINSFGFSAFSAATTENITAGAARSLWTTRGWLPTDQRPSAGTTTLGARSGESSSAVTSFGRRIMSLAIASISCSAESQAAGPAQPSSEY